MKNIRNKIFCTITVVLTLFMLILLFDVLKFNKVQRDVKKYFRVSYVLVDKEKTKNANFDDYNSYTSNTLETYSVVEKVTKEGNYYVAKLHYMKDFVYDNTVKNHYAMNNLNGEVIDDIKYDKSTKKAYIPKKYFESKKYEKYNGIPVQMEFVSRIDEKEFKKGKIGVSINKWMKTTKQIYNKNNEEFPSFSAFKYKKGKNITKKDMHVFVNEDSLPLDDDKYTYDSKAGTITINMYPVMVKSINVKIKKTALAKNSILNILNIKDVFAAKAPAIEGTVSIDTTNVNLSYFNNESGSFSAHYIYKADDGYFSSYKDEDLGIEKGWNSGRIAKVEQLFKSVPIATANKEGKILDFLIKFDSTSVSKGYTYACPTENDPNKTCEGTATLTLKNKANRHWLRFWCDGEHVAVDNNSINKLDFRYTVKVSNNVVTINPTSVQTAGKQNASGTFSIKGSLYSLKVRKKLYVSATGEKQEFKQPGIIYRVYSDFATDTQGNVDKSNCNGKVLGEEETDANGVATFTNLPESGTYCVKEIFKETKSSSPISAKDYYRDASCDGVIEDVSLHNGNIGDRALEASTSDIVAENDYCNVRRKFATAIKKVDSDTNENLRGFKFTLTPGNYETPETNDSGYTKLCDIPTYQAYTFSETGTASEYWGPNTTASVTAPTYVDKYGDTFPDFANSGLVSYPDGTACPADTSVANVGTFQNTHKFYCIKIKKVDFDDPSKVLNGATFQADGTNISLTRNSQISYGNTSAKSAYRESNGITTILTADHKEAFKITEIEAPAGYAKSSQTPYATPTLISTAKKWSEIDFSDCDTYLPDSSASVIVMEDTALSINWYKVSETNNTKISGAQFKVKKGTATIYHEADKKVSTDVNGTEKTCYVASATSTGDGSDVFVADADGEVCVRGVEEGSYTVTETLPGEYHSFGESTTKSIDASETFVARDDSANESNKFVNLPTGFRFTKTVKANDGADNDDQTIVINGVEKTVTQLNTEELKKIDFEVYVADANGNPTGSPLQFIKNETTGIYEYSSDNANTVHGATGTATSILHLDDERNISIDHLPWEWNGSSYSKTYVIREVQSKVCDETKSEEDCIGYYYPNYSAKTSTFNITPCSYDKDLVNADSCPTRGFATQTLENIPTLFEFTKKDFYGYDDEKDVQDKNREKDESEVEFESAKERSDFDRIDFRVKDSNDNYMNFIYMGNSGSCTDPNSYSIYKYVPGLQLPEGVAGDVFNDVEFGITQTVHACGGHIHFTNLCRGNTYTVYEDEVPSDSVFVRESKLSPAPSTSVKIPCIEDTEEPEKTSTTAIIEDKPTYLEVQKRDSKYNYLIPDENTTFRLYQCKKDTECHPTDVADDPNTDEDERLTAENVRRVIKFYERGTLQNNEEVSKDLKNSEGDLIDAEVYRAMSDSDVDSNASYVTDVHPYLGRLVFRYLQSGYNYVLVETRAPKNYMLPVGVNAETKFTVVNDTVDVEAKDTPNVPTSLLIRKYDKDGDKLLAGAEFKIYRSQEKCNFNQKPWAQTGLTPLKLKTIRDGVYEARPETDTETIRTCLDKEGALCSEIPTNTQTRLTDLEYAVGSGDEENTWADFENILYKSEENGVSKTEKVNLQEGEALVQYLEYGHCYVIEETKAPTGYSLPKDKKDRFTMVQIEDNEQYGHDTRTIFKNTPTPFTFFKYDEFNQPLDGAEFKLQKLNDDKKYEDIAVTLEEKGDELFYKYEGLAKEDSNTVINTKGGKATVYYLPVGQYRIVETKAAPGKELTKNPNIATFFVDDAGNTFGNAIVVNKAETKKIIPKNSATAELIVNIQTGQIVIRYGAIILTIVGLIIGLMMLKKKTK